MKLSDLGFQKIFTKMRRSKLLTVKNVSVGITVIIVFAILASNFVGFYKENMIAYEKQIIASIRAGIGEYFIESVTKNRLPVYPDSLDKAESGLASIKNPFFTAVIPYPGVTDPKWRKLLSTIYQGPSGAVYFYDTTLGDLKERPVFSDKIGRELKISPSKITGDLLEQLKYNNVVIFADGKKLIGGALLVVPRITGRSTLEGEKVKDQRNFDVQGQLRAEIISKKSPEKSYIKFGYYKTDTYTGKQILYEVFDGSEQEGFTRQFVIEPNSGEIGFYFCIPEDPKNTFFYYSNNELNPGKTEYVRSYANEAFKKITFTFDQNPQGRQRDFQDIIVTVSY